MIMKKNFKKKKKFISKFTDKNKIIFILLKYILFIKKIIFLVYNYIQLLLSFYYNFSLKIDAFFKKGIYIGFFFYS